MRTTLLAAAVALFAGSTAFAQEQDPEKTKKDILDKVRARIQEEHRKILERMSKLLDEELAAGEAKPPVDPPVKQPVDPKGTSAENAKKIREIQKKLQALDDQRDDLLKQIRGIKRSEDDAEVKKEAKNVPEDNETVDEMFKEYLDIHNAATEKLKANKKDEAVAGFKKSIAGFKKLYYRFSDRRFGAISAYNVACAYSLINERDEALDWIELAIGSGYGQPADYDHMRQDSDLDNLRKERRYQKLMLDK